MVDRVTGGGRAPPPPPPGWADFSIMSECAPESGHCQSVIPTPLPSLILFTYSYPALPPFLLSSYVPIPIPPYHPSLSHPINLFQSLPIPLPSVGAQDYAEDMRILHNGYAVN